MVLTEVVLRPTQKTRSVGPDKSILKKDGNKRKSNQENKKFRSMCKPTYDTTADHNVNNSLKSSRHLLRKIEDRNIYPHTNTCTLFLISWKFTKKRSRIIRDISIPDHLPHHALSNRINLKTGLPSMIDKDERLQYDLIKRLLFINKITVPNVHACVSYFIIRMESPSICHKNDLLQLNVISIKKLQLLVLSSKEEHRIHLKTSLSNILITY